jgi:hypothetical protein
MYLRMAPLGDWGMDSANGATAAATQNSQVVGGGDFVGDQRWSAEVAAVCGLAVTLRTVFLEDSVLGQ